MTAQKRADNRRRIWWIAGTLAFVVAVLAILVLVTDDDDDETDTASNTSTSTTTTSTPVESAAGKPCVPVADPLPTGAPEVPVKEGPPPTELITEDLVVGTGDAVPASATVTVNYIGVSCSTGVIFDSSYERGQPATFGLDEVIPGWTDGIPGMNVGGQRLLGIPSDQAYGPQGRPPTIAPDESLWFVVTVEDFEPAAAAAPAP